MPLDLEFIPHGNFFVFAETSTGLIRRWMSIAPAEIALQIKDADETVVRVSRKPDLTSDKYVNLATGAMSAEAVEQGA